MNVLRAMLQSSAQENDIWGITRYKCRNRLHAHKALKPLSQQAMFKDPWTCQMMLPVPWPSSNQPGLPEHNNHNQPSAPAATYWSWIFMWYCTTDWMVSWSRKQATSDLVLVLASPNIHRIPMIHPYLNGKTYKFEVWMQVLILFLALCFQTNPMNNSCEFHRFHNSTIRSFLRENIVITNQD